MVRCVKSVYFNTEKDEDILEFVGKITNFSDWIREVIKRESQKNQINYEVDPRLIKALETIVDNKLSGVRVIGCVSDELKDDILRSEVIKTFSESNTSCSTSSNNPLKSDVSVFF